MKDNENDIRVCMEKQHNLHYLGVLQKNTTLWLRIMSQSLLLNGAATFTTAFH